ncbi:fibrobacter succinogenes major paralogous domain-containing protein [Candidatus Saccharibacteria bacterium]|nr:fibrobacter succinogenes major paralogous domain-containing protein [Candidatus Saccharibacteria bacterium]
MRNVFFCLLVGILLLGCSEENPSDVFANSANGDSSSSVIELSSSDIGNSSSEDFANFSSSFDVISNTTETSSSSWPQYSYGELIDERDGQVYKTVTIGSQTWMAENLNYAYTQPINGLDSGSWCNNNDPENCAKYGRLYTWAAAMDSIAYFKEENDNCLKSCTHDCEKCGFGVNWQIGTNFEKYKGFNILGVCPENWHIPSVNEWFILLDLVNTIDLKSTSGWIDDGNGTDIFGFGLLPAGTKKNQDKNNNIGEITCFWPPLQGTNVLDETGTNNYYEIAGVFCFSSKSENAAYKGEDKTSALSVRCIKD